MKKTIAFVVATLFGVGRINFAPGTFGSLATLPIAFACAYFYGINGVIIGAAVAFVVGVWACFEVLKFTPHDPCFVVIDEVVGQLITFLAVAPCLKGNDDAWMIYFIGFVLFRIFDIFKPQPVGWADRSILNAWGVMVDDVFAGLYAMVVLYGIKMFGWI